MEIIQYTILFFSMVGAYSSWYNTFMIQRPWFKDYNDSKNINVDYELNPSCSERKL